jgi:phosphate butyryltransferase
VNKASAEHKHYDSPAAGEADILLVPNITAGNIFVKGLLEFAGAKMAGLVTGAKCPIALNSRSATDEEKYAALMAAAGMIPEK